MQFDIANLTNYSLLIATGTLVDPLSTNLLVCQLPVLVKIDNLTQFSNSLSAFDSAISGNYPCQAANKNGVE
jgi:hypothetical protein